MLTITDPNDFLFEYIASRGFTVTKIDKVMSAGADDVAVQALVDTYDPLEDAQLSAITQVKTKAGELILTKLPEWKQRNLMAETLELMSAPNDGIRLAEINALWQIAKDIRSASDLEEKRLLAQTDWKLCSPDFSGMESI